MIGSKIPIKPEHKKISENEKLAETLREMGDNLTLALNTSSKRLSSQFRIVPCVIKVNRRPGSGGATYIRGTLG